MTVVMKLSVLLLVGMLLLALATVVAGGDNGLLAHYTFDEGPGSVIVDHSGRGNDGQPHGVTFVPSGEGYALRLDGRDDYVDCGSSDSLAPAQIPEGYWQAAEEIQYQPAHDNHNEHPKQT